MTRSIWQPFNGNFPAPLSSVPKSCDVCIVGSGIAGLTAAYQLVKQGVEVLLISDSMIGGGETGKSTAQINTVHDDGWTQMEKIHGMQKLRLCAASYREALQFIKFTSDEEGIECGFEYLPGYLFGGDQKENIPEWKEELAAAERAGVHGITLISEVGLPTFRTGPALRYEKQAQFHPLAYLHGIAAAADRSGKFSWAAHQRVVDVQEVRGTRAADGVAGHDRDRLKVVLVNGNEIEANAVVLATNVPMHHKLIPHASMEPYRSYVITLPIDRDAIENAQYWDTNDPYHYARLVSRSRNVLEHATLDDEELLLVGGEDHPVGEGADPEQHFQALLTWAKEHFPIKPEIRNYWSAQTIETFDGMPLIGHCIGDVENLFIITGDSGMGITHGTLGGLIVPELIAGNSHRFAEIYDPGRTRVRALGRFLKQNVRSLSHYREWLLPNEVANEAEIVAGSGAIIRDGLKRLAVYKDVDGSVVHLSAMCPHLGALLHWNSVEHSWDCPAHGSRFSQDGKLLNGPAARDLECENCPLTLAGNGVKEEVVEDEELEILEPELEHGV